MISVSGLEKSFGDRTLFRDVTFVLGPGERYGLVGANGSGKTTLLNILAGDLESSAGSVSVPGRVRLGVLRQDQFLYEDQEILDVTLMGNEDLWRATTELNEVLARADDHFDAARFSELEEIVQRHDGYTADSRAAAILEGLGLPAKVHRQPLSTLSGGFRLRVLLAQVLASAPDALLLDEPTNHLDILSIRWLEKFLRDFRGPAVVISHDHRFLDNIATHILDVDYETVHAYPGNYTRFLGQKAAERERREKEIAVRQREIAHHRKFVDRFRAKASKARQAQSRVRMIEKKAEGLEELPRSSRRYPTFRFGQRRASGQEVVRARGISKSFGDNRVLHEVDLRVGRGDRLAIVGPNGIGKSTLLKVMMGELAPDAGSVEWGYEAHPGYFAQDPGDHLRTPRRTAEAWIEEYCAGRGIGFARGKMGMVLFSGDDAEKRLEALSGGESARLVLCSLMIREPNVLVLDEPTNHLDLESIDALVKGLRGYPGTLVFVSHDRWFVERLANRIVEIGQDGIRDYRGTYGEYVRYCGDDHLDVAAVTLRAREEKRRARGMGDRADGVGGDGAGDAAGAGGAGGRDGAGREARRGRRRRPARPTYRQRQLAARGEKLAGRIEAAEARVAEIEGVFAAPSFYGEAGPAEVQALEAERQGLIDDIARLMEEGEGVEAEIGRGEG